MAIDPTGTLSDTIRIDTDPMSTPRKQLRKKVRVDVGQPLGQVILQVAPANVVTAPARPMSPKQLAEFLGVNPQTVKRHSSDWPSFNVGSKRRFDGAAVVRHLLDKTAKK